MGINTIKIQWGVGSSSNNVTLGHAYNNTDYAILATNEYTATNYVGDTIKSDSIKVTGFTILGTSTANLKSHWFTLGY